MCGVWRNAMRTAFAITRLSPSITCPLDASARGSTPTSGAGWLVREDPCLRARARQRAARALGEGVARRALLLERARVCVRAWGVPAGLLLCARPS